MALTIGNTTIRALPTARARFARTVLVLLVLGFIAFIAPQAAASDGPGEFVADTWTVSEGETLWSIAAAHTLPGGDVRATLEDIKDLNAFTSSQVQAGTQIYVPIYS